MYKIMTGLTLTIVLSACATQLPPYVPDPPGPDPTTTVPPPPVTTSNRYVFGDSITAQLMSTEAQVGDGRIWSGISGATLGSHQANIEAALAEPAEEVDIALSSNDGATWTDGWTTSDEALWTSVLDKANPATCVMIILPWALPSLEEHYPGSAANFDAARAWLWANDARPNVVVQDWKPYVDAHPEIIAEDGLHLKAWGYEPANPAALTRLAAMNEGERQCA